MKIYLLLFILWNIPPTIRAQPECRDIPGNGKQKSTCIPFGLKTVTTDEMKAAYYKEIGKRQTPHNYWNNPALDKDWDRKFLYSLPSFNGPDLLSKEGLCGKWTYAQAEKGIDLLCLVDTWNETTGKRDSLFLEQLRQQYGSTPSDSARGYAGGDIPVDPADGTLIFPLEPMRYFGFIVSPNLLLIHRKNGKAERTQWNCRSAYYNEAYRYKMYIDGYWAGRIDLEFDLLSHDAKRICGTDSSLKQRHTYDLLLTIDPKGGLDLVLLYPQKTDTTDRYHLNKLRTFVRTLPVWSLECLYTADGRLFPGRYVRAVLTKDGWTLSDYLEAVFRSMESGRKWKEHILPAERTRG